GRVAGEAAGATAPEPAGAAARQDHRDRGALADPPACRPDRDRGYRRSRPWALRQPPRLVCLGRPGDLLGPARGVCTPPDPGSPQGTLLPSSLRDRFLASLPFGFLSYQLASEQVVTELTHAAEALWLLRFLRLGRLVQILRFVRLALPVVSIARLGLFFLRLSDRLVRKHAGLLNRN